MAKVRKFEDGLKLSIRGKIVGLLLQDLDSMVRISMAIEREVDVHGTTGMWVLLKIRGRRVNLFLLARGISIRLLLRKDFRDKVAATKAKAKANHFHVADLLGLTTS